jgi:pyridine nucleotide-disulfide oxidoreductase domain-containing protein 1
VTAPSFQVSVCSQRYHARPSRASAMLPQRKKVAVVVGGGVAGATCAAELAARTSRALVDVVLISPAPFVRVATAGSRSSAVEVSAAPAEAWAAAAGVRVERAAAAALRACSVALADGRALAFDVCCVATGARPWVPKVFERAGEALRSRVLTVRDTDSVAVLRAAVGTARRVLVVGNGGIAMELCFELKGTECEVVWAIRGEFIGNSFFDRRGGEAMFRFLERAAGGDGLDHGDTSLVDGGKEIGKVQGAGAGPEWLGQREGPILFGSVVAKCESSAATAREGRMAPQDDSKLLRIERSCEVTRVGAAAAASGWPVLVELSNGKSIECDFVVCATGVRPNVEWMGSLSRVPIDDRSSLHSDMTDPDCRGGILVHAGNLQSCGRADVFGAGDCATIVRSADMRADEGNNWFQMRLWTQAAMSARAAATGMAAAVEPGIDVGYGMEFDLFAHATRFFGQRVVLLGRYNAQGLGQGYRVVEGGDDEHFIRVVVEDGRVRGALLIGDADLSETYENLILDRLDVSHIAQEELVDPSIDLEDYFD